MTSLHILNMEQHLAHSVRGRIHFSLGVCLKPSKCQFLHEKVKYCPGKIVFMNGFEVDPAKVEALHEMVPPHSLVELQCCLGIIGFHLHHF